MLHLAQDSFAHLPCSSTINTMLGEHLPMAKKYSFISGLQLSHTKALVSSAREMFPLICVDDEDEIFPPLLPMLSRGNSQNTLRELVGSKHSYVSPHSKSASTHVSGQQSLRAARAQESKRVRQRRDIKLSDGAKC